jgi:pimeloyl-ACP methyl ester carboxylesterase
MSRIVLVHGAFCNARVWGSRFVEGLEALGHRVEAIDLPSHGDDPTPREGVSLQSYANRVVDVLNSSSEPAVLVGHSMAGLVITQAADDFIAAGGSLERLIYVAAVLPRDGKSQNDYTTLPEGAGDLLAGHLVVEGSPKVATLMPGAAGPALFGHCSPEITCDAESMLEGQVIRVLFTPVAITDDRPIARSYIVCTEDFAIPPALQRLMVSQTPNVRAFEIESDHSPFLSHPQEFLEVFEKAITG